MFPRLHTLAFEAEPEPPLEGGGEEAPPESDPPDTEPPPSASVDYDSPEFQQAVQYAAQDAIGTMLQQAAQQEEGGDEGDELIDPEVKQYLEGMMQRTVQSQMEQIRPTVQAFEDQQNQAKVEEWCEKIPAITETQEMLGEEANASSLVQFAATGYLPELEERYGPGERATQTALRMAADQIKGAVKAAHAAGYQARNAELQGLSGARPPLAIAPVEGVQLREEPKDEMAAAALWSSRNGLE